MNSVRMLLVAGSTLLATPVVAQAPAPSPVAPAAPGAPAPPTPPANYAYSVDGRRDPFAALVSRTGVPRGETPVMRAEGLPGLTVDELVVRGILQSRGTWVAMVSGPAGKVFTVKPGDRLADGMVRSITPEAVILQQQVNDPMSLEKQREVRKFLRGGENK